ncbi:MAG: endonuclease/exonuclease/phosphatase family protein [Ignavibacteriales bacterium]
MTFNIRLDVPEDGLNSWDNRKANLVGMLKSHNVDIVGLQEAQRHQIDYIQKSLPDYEWFGVGRDDGKDAGEFTAIFYRKERFDTLKTSTFWLSETPEHQGKGWDAAYQRITTFGKFQDRLSGKVFFLFNTHLDNEGELARIQSAKLIKNKIELYCKNYPVVLTGDFNSFPESEPYQITVTKEKLHSSKQLYDSRKISKTKPIGPLGTFTGFDIKANPTQPIDYIFVSKGISVLSHQTLSDSFNGFLPSDHYPILIEILLKKN